MPFGIRPLTGDPYACHRNGVLQAGGHGSRAGLGGPGQRCVEREGRRRRGLCA